MQIIVVKKCECPIEMQMIVVKKMDSPKTFGDFFLYFLDAHHSCTKCECPIKMQIIVVENIMCAGDGFSYTSLGFFILNSKNTEQ